MKTKSQVDHFLKKKMFATRMDYELISSYCYQQYKLKLSVPDKFSEDDASEKSLDCTKFNKWIEFGFGAGDIIQTADSVGLVQYGDIETSTICFKIDSNGATTASDTFLNKDIKKADESACKSLKMNLRKQRLEFGNPYMVLTEKFVPRPKTFSKFHRISDGIDGCGAVSYIDSQENVYMFCYFTSDGQVKYNLNEYIGTVDDLTFTAFGAEDYPRRQLDDALATVGKTWNHKLYRIEPLHMKAEIGQTYWYIDHTDMKIKTDQENGKRLSQNRYKVGNYFLSPEDAVEMLDMQTDLIRKFLARPEKKA